MRVNKRFLRLVKAAQKLDNQAQPVLNVQSNQKQRLCICLKKYIKKTLTTQTGGYKLQMLSSHMQSVKATV